MSVVAKGKILVIVESPAKAKTIEKYLGKEYIVRASVGHVRDLPKSNKKASRPYRRVSAKEVRKRAMPFPAIRAQRKNFALL